MGNLLLEDSLSKLKGIGAKKEAQLESMGLSTVGACVNYLPYRYMDKRTVVPAVNAKEGQDSLVIGELVRIRTKYTANNRAMVECTMRDSSCIFTAVFFNMPFIKNVLKIGSSYVLFGKVAMRNGARVWTNPEFCIPGGERDRRGIIPVYKTSPGITSTNITNWIKEALERADLSCEWIDSRIVDHRRICSPKYAYNNIHFPADTHSYQVAKYRLIYEELLRYQLAIRLARQVRESSQEDSSIPPTDISVFTDSLPFELTEGQQKCIFDIAKDLEMSRPMNRLVQGDVGCGKTVVAEAAMWKCVKAGYQVAMMAPTEILARQHYETVSRDFDKWGFKTVLLVSGMSAKDRRAAIEGIGDGSIDVVIGTHAIIQKDVEFSNLALVITDEQHRFGVNQRKLFARKGRGVNVCVMSATPIPRTLAATVFGDMDFSIIRSMPSNRKPIITRAFDKESRERAYAAARGELEAGNLVYVVAPSIDSEDEDMTSVNRLYEDVRQRFPRFNAALLHGRMTKEEKEAIMHDFASAKVQILVATVVIEVGVDIPNATMMIVENSERFGLAQLHQLRGRVGRSDKQSYCFLINYSKSEKACLSEKSMVEIIDGFEISEMVFRLRGPGDLAGTMQSGVFSNNILSLCAYTDILSIAIEDAERIMASPGGTDIEYILEFMAVRAEADN